MRRALLDNEHAWMKLLHSGKNYQGPVEEVLADVPGTEKAVLDIGYVSCSFIVFVNMFIMTPRADVGLVCGEHRCRFAKLVHSTCSWLRLQDP